MINGDVELHQIAGQAHAIQQKGHRQNPLEEGTGQTRQQEARHLLQADGVARQPTGKGHKGEGEQAPHVRKDQGQRRQHLNGKVHLILELLLAHPWSQVRRTGLVEELFGELHQDRQHHEHVRGGKGDGQWRAEAAQQLAHRNRRHPGNHQGQKQASQQQRDPALQHDIDRQARQLGALDRGAGCRQDREHPKRGETGHKSGDAE